MCDCNTILSGPDLSNFLVCVYTITKDTTIVEKDVKLTYPNTVLCKAALKERLCFLTW